MKKPVKKILAFLLAAALVFGALPALATAAGTAPQTTTGNNPLTVTITADKNSYTLFSTIEFKATIKNTSTTESLENVSANVLFGADLSPVAVGVGKTSATAATLGPQQSITLTYQARLNKLKSLDSLLILFKLIFGGKTVTYNNPTSSGTPAATQTKKVNLLSIVASQYDCATTVNAYGSVTVVTPPDDPDPDPDPDPTDGSAVMQPDVEMLSQVDSENFIKNAKPLEMNDDGSMSVKLPAGMTFDEGDIFMVRPTADNPLGVTGKVTSVEGDTIVIEQPTLGEVFTDMNVGLEKTLTADNMLGDPIACSGVNLQPQSQTQGLASQANMNFSKIWDLDYTLYKNPSGYGDVKLGGSLGFKSIDIALDADFDIKNLDETKISADANVDLYADVHLKATGSYKFGLKSGDSLLSGGLNTPLGKFTLGGIYTENKIPLVRVLFDVGTMSFQAGVGNTPVTGILAVSLELTTTLGGEVGGSLSMGASYECYVHGGFTFDNAASKKFDWRGSFTSAQAPSAFFNADGYFKGQARVGVDLAFYALGCKLAAITNDIAMFGEAELAVAASTGGGGLDDSFINAQIVLKLIGAAQFALKAKYQVPDWTPFVGGKEFVIIDVDETYTFYDVPIWEKDFGARAMRAGFNGHTYAVFNLQKTWTEAKAECEKLGGHLVTITSPQEQAYVETLLSRLNRNFYWLGAFAPTVTKGSPNIEFTWVTGEPFDNYHANSSYNWCRDKVPNGDQIFEPNGNWNGTDQYAAIWNKKADAPYLTFGKWQDLPNAGGVGLTNGYICEWD